MSTTIIAQPGSIVNVYPKNVTIATQKRLTKAREKRAERQADEKKPMFIRWDEHKKDAQNIGNRLIEAGLPKRGWRIKMCSQELIINRCRDCGSITIKGAQLCRDRLCPLCAWRLAIKRYAAMQSIMAALYEDYSGYAYRLVTLTCRTCAPDKLSQTIELMQQAWHECVKQRWARRELIGWAKSLECTYNAERDEIHPHYHLIVMHAPGDGVPGRLVREWLDRCKKVGLVAVYEAQHIDYIVDNHEAGESLAGAICEVYKYMVKSKDTASMPLSTLATFAREIAGFRLVSFGGLIKKVAAAMKLDKLDSPDDSTDIEVCTKCKSTDVDTMIARWSLRGMHYYTMQGKSMIDILSHPVQDTRVSDTDDNDDDFLPINDDF